MVLKLRLKKPPLLKFLFLTHHFMMTNAPQVCNLINVLQELSTTSKKLSVRSKSSIITYMNIKQYFNFELDLNEKIILELRCLHICSLMRKPWKDPITNMKRRYFLWCSFRGTTSRKKKKLTSVRINLRDYDSLNVMAECNCFIENLQAQMNICNCHMKSDWKPIWVFHGLLIDGKTMYLRGHNLLN